MIHEVIGQLGLHLRHQKHPLGHVFSDRFGGVPMETLHHFLKHTKEQEPGHKTLETCGAPNCLVVNFKITHLFKASVHLVQHQFTSYQHIEILQGGLMAVLRRTPRGNHTALTEKNVSQVQEVVSALEGFLYCLWRHHNLLQAVLFGAVEPHLSLSPRIHWLPGVN